MTMHMEIKTNLSPMEEIEQTEKNNFLEATKGFVIKKLQENPDKDTIEVTIDDIRNVAAMEEIREDYLELMKKSFEKDGIKVNIKGESDEKCFQFTIPPEKIV